MLRHTRLFLSEWLADPGHWLPNLTWRATRRRSDLEVVFVVGAPRSGTTLMQNVLAGHDALFSIQRETDLFSYRNIFAPQRNFFGLSPEETADLLRKSCDIVDFFERGVGALAQRSKGKRFIEKTPQHIKRIAFLAAHFPRARFIHVVRDGRDCYRSAKHHPSIKQARSAAAFASYWAACVRHPTKLDRDDLLLTVRYEDFVSAPEVKLGEIMSFLGLDFQREQLDPQTFGSDRRAERSVFQRLRSPVSDATVGKWQEELDEVEQRTFLRIAYKELKAYRYA